jgi:hypothetical protein
MLTQVSKENYDSIATTIFPTDSIKNNPYIALLSKEFTSPVFKTCISLSTVAFYSRKKSNISAYVYFLTFRAADGKTVRNLFKNKLIGNHVFKVWNQYVCHFVGDTLIIVDSYSPGDSLTRQLNVFLYSKEINSSDMNSQDSLFCSDTAGLAPKFLKNSKNVIQMLISRCPVDTVYTDSFSLVTGGINQSGKFVQKWAVDTLNEKCRGIIFSCPKSLTIATTVARFSTMLPDVQKISIQNRDIIKCQYNYTKHHFRIFTEDTMHAKFLAYYRYYP